MDNYNAGIVVGEISGDALGFALIQALQNHFPKLNLTGVPGPKLLSLSCQELFPMERLNVMGLVEPLFRIPELYFKRRALINYFTAHKPNVFIGIDAPDFNLGLEKRIRFQKIPTVHYVSPTVWAWRKNRINLIREAVDLMLTLYPFEAKFYQEHNVPVCFTGHPFADQIPLSIDKARAKKALGLNERQTLVGLLPGSRHNELKYLAKIYLETAKWCYQHNNNLSFHVPLVSEQHQSLFETLRISIAPDLPIQTSLGNARDIMSAADVVLVTSGTATLEVMLHKTPMVVAYRMHPITYQIAKRLVKIPYISQPNLLAEEALVPEFIQEDIHPETLGKALFENLNANAKHDRMCQRFQEIHEMLRKNAAVSAANAVAELIS